jgi:NitT/TauT family transport system substrate-binding protein
MDIGYSPGTNSVLAAYVQGAKIKIISTEFLGRTIRISMSAPIAHEDHRRHKGKSVAYPRPGGASEGVLLGLKAERQIDFKAVATAAPWTRPSPWS